MEENPRRRRKNILEQIVQQPDNVVEQIVKPANVVEQVDNVVEQIVQQPDNVQEQIVPKRQVLRIKRENGNWHVFYADATVKYDANQPLSDILNKN